MNTERAIEMTQPKKLSPTTKTRESEADQGVGVGAVLQEHFLSRQFTING